MDWLLDIMAEQQGFAYSQMGSRLSVALPLPLDLRHLRHQKADLVAIELGDRANAVNVPQQVFGCAEECLKRRLAIAASEHVVCLSPHAVISAAL